VRIVVVTPAVPHPFGDTAARWFYVLITELVARGHDVVAVVATEEPDELVAAARQWLPETDGQLTLHLHRLKVDSVALRRKWQNLMRPRSELLQDSDLTACWGENWQKVMTFCTWSRCRPAGSGSVCRERCSTCTTST